MRGWLVLCSVAGCVRSPPPAAAPAEVVVQVQPPEPERRMEHLLDVAWAVAALPVERQAEEVAVWRDRVARAGLAADRLQLAAILTAVDPELREPQEVTALLRDGPWDEQPGLGALARLLLAVEAEREDLRRELVTATVDADRQRAQASELRAQLDALREIEADLDARDTP